MPSACGVSDVSHIVRVVLLSPFSSAFDIVPLLLPLQEFRPLPLVLLSGVATAIVAVSSLSVCGHR